MKYYDENRNGYYNPDDGQDSLVPGENANWRAIQAGFAASAAKDSQQDTDVATAASAAEAARRTADQALEAAQAAGGDITDLEAAVAAAQQTADGAATAAQTARGLAESAGTAAQSAASAAQAAQTTADGAATAAQTAQTTANGAVSDASAAQTTASSAAAAAQAAQTTADGAAGQAYDAYAAAMSANGTAEGARNMASSAFTAATNANQAAQEAGNTVQALLPRVAALESSTGAITWFGTPVYVHLDGYNSEAVVVPSKQIRRVPYRVMVVDVPQAGGGTENLPEGRYVIWDSFVEGLGGQFSATPIQVGKSGIGFYGHIIIDANGTPGGYIMIYAQNQTTNDMSIGIASTLQLGVWVAPVMGGVQT